MTTSNRSGTGTVAGNAAADVAATTAATGSPPMAVLDPTLRRVVAIVVLGALITVLDATVVSVAIKSMATDFAASLATIQWSMTGYLLAMVAVIPLSGWVVDRYGGRRAWLAAVGLFVVGSALSALAWSAPSLIVARVIQGLGGGLVAPVGMTMVAQAAGPQRMGRAMAMVGIPMMLGPVLGPILGGVLVSTLDWRWIFLINLPLGLATMAWSAKGLPRHERGAGQRLDLLGVVLLVPACTALVYGLAEAAGGATGGIPARAVVAVVLGTALLAGFIGHAGRAAGALLDLRQLRNSTFAGAAVIQLLTGAVLIGTMFLFPLFFQLDRGQSAWVTGLLLTPQGIGAAIALWLTGRLVDRGHGFRVVLAGVALTTLGMVAFTQAPAGPPTWLLVASLLVLGLGTGCLMGPVSAAAYSVLPRSAIPRATSLLNVTQRLGGALGTAGFALLLQHGHQLGTTGTATANAVSEAFGATFWWPVAFSAAMVLPVLLLRPARSPARHHDGDTP